MTSIARRKDPHRATASRRILDAARSLVSAGGAAQISIGHVAQAADVSKALVHYHFRDKDSLLHALVEDLGVGMIARARAFVSEPGSDNVLDRYWSWLATELELGEVRMLLALSECDSARVRAAARRVGDQRRALAIAQVQLVFTRLGLTPRVPAALIADTVTAFADGLAAGVAVSPERAPRPAFDVLWLALLTLAE